MTDLYSGMLTTRHSFAAITVIFQLIILFSLWGHMSFAQMHLSQKISSEAATAFEFLDSLLQPKLGCKGKEYIITDFGEGGGFASQFQMAATHWLRVSSGHNYTIPVLIRGHIRGYTSGKECQHVMNDYTCMFLPMSTCQHELLSTGILVNEHKHTKEMIDSSMVPSQFAHKGLAWWWGIIQARMFRLQPVVENYIKDELEHMKTMNSGRGFPFGSPIAGLHVRHGDKSIDGFMDHSFEAELKAIRKSPECILGPENYCFTNSIPMESNISEARNTTSLSSQQNRNISTPSLETADGNSNDRNTDGKILELATKPRYSSAKMVIYVASDDDKVLVSAKKLGHLVDSSGFSQKTSGTGEIW